ncbi:hypothetical protein D0X99_14655 [Algoriphagus lacus]|uniref:Uncharacterized protein n=1 Tax=Algoriphagus lacus TaxID=2056311 RepID=A0A418PPN8_9BACT|nr:hypothetical protein D0X99_14655 [Algoriphagus lacus]
MVVLGKRVVPNLHELASFSNSQSTQQKPNLGESAGKSTETISKRILGLPDSLAFNFCYIFGTQ